MKKTPLAPISRFILASLVMLLLVVSFLLGRQSKTQTRLVSDTSREAHDTKIANLEDEINRCIQDKTKTLSEKEAIYSFDQTGVYTPLLKGKQMRVVEYDYNRNTVQSSEIMLNEFERVNLFRRTKKYYASGLPLGSNGLFDMPIIIGDKLSGIDGRVETKLSTIQDKWESQESFTTQYGLRFRYDNVYYTGPGQPEISGIIVHGIIGNSALGEPIYVRVEVIGTRLSKDTTAVNVKATRDRARAIAESINWKNTDKVD